MAKLSQEQILADVLARHPRLESSVTDIKSAIDILVQVYDSGKKLLVCGNGGSAADCDHIVAELMNRFEFKRALPARLKEKLNAGPNGSLLAQQLQPGLKAISLVSHTGLMTAISNDLDPSLIFAQQLMGYGDEGDVLLAISTSGNSKNILMAIETAKALGMKVIGLSGRVGGGMVSSCDVTIRVDASDTKEIQELHLPVYHLICQVLEQHYFVEA